MNNRATLNEIVERCLRGAALWDEVKDRLNDSALNLFRRPGPAAVQSRGRWPPTPEVLLLDEPASPALDPASTSRI